MTGPAVFLDRDGTIIADTGFIRDVADVRLLPGAAHAIRRLNLAGWPVVVVTNQSGIARGLLREEEYRAVAARMELLLAQDNAKISSTFMCPHYPPLTGPCECRKPGLLHYRAAAEQLALDLSRSAWVGDRLTDLLPARAFGGSGWLVRTGEEPAAVEAERQGFAVVPDLNAAVDRILDRD